MFPLARVLQGDYNRAGAKAEQGRSAMAERNETILIVDDEESVRRTFREWLDKANLGCTVLSAADAEAALLLANAQPIDLAILDWNLGAGNDGLQLLEDLSVFHPEVVAILVTGFADQATPLTALRMGVSDYLDKNQDLNRETFLAAVRKQLDRIRPARRERQLHQTLVAFRAAVEKILPLVQSTAALRDPVPLTAGVRILFRFLLRATGAADGALVVRDYVADRQPAENYRAYRTDGTPLVGELIPWGRSLAASVMSMQQPSVLTSLGSSTGSAGFLLQPFEQGRQTVLAAGMPLAPGIQVVLELFDKPGGFTSVDQHLVAAATEFGAELLRHALAEKETHRLLFDAVEAALGASETVAASLLKTTDVPRTEAPPAAVLDQLRKGLRQDATGIGADELLPLAEAIRSLAVRHGSDAVRHCTRLVETVRDLLDAATGMT